MTTVNLDRYDSDGFISAVRGDACDPPVEVRHDRFDLVVSNSLVEHVGGHAQRRRLAEVVHTAADRNWIQTPYRYFPVEPHWMFPGMQFLPFSARVAMSSVWPMGNRRTPDRAEATEWAHEVELIGIAQMRSYFPESTIWLERLAGLVKSLVAIR